MTIQLFKAKEAAIEHATHLSIMAPWSKQVVVKIKFDKRDGPMFGARGFTFNARHGSTYYIVAESKEDAQSWGLFSKILG